ncbi:MAG: hypothetical protein KBH81_07445 [Phycisphaerae bacterium]|nr:hypothetical protein [Phycisphaerae bacterium]
MAVTFCVAAAGWAAFEAPAAELAGADGVSASPAGGAVVAGDGGKAPRALTAFELAGAAAEIALAEICCAPVATPLVCGGASPALSAGTTGIEPPGWLGWAVAAGAGFAAAALWGAAAPCGSLSASAWAVEGALARLALAFSRAAASASVRWKLSRCSVAFCCSSLAI